MNKTTKISPIKAFTLAEVLITTIVIGVIAALSIPTLMHYLQSLEYKIAYKKVFSIASQAWLSADKDGLIIYTNTGSGNTNIANFLSMQSKMSIIKDCNPNYTQSYNCWTSGESLAKVLPSNAWAFVDTSGASWAIRCTGTPPSGSGACMSIIQVDINGFRKPNILGKDRFMISPKFTNEGTRLTPMQDYVVQDPDYCPSPPCYYTSWLLN